MYDTYGMRERSYLQYRYRYRSHRNYGTYRYSTGTVLYWYGIYRDLTLSFPLDALAGLSAPAGRVQEGTHHTSANALPAAERLRTEALLSTPRTVPLAHGPRRPERGP